MGTRRWAIRGGAVLAVAVAVAVLPGLGASQRQGTIADEAYRNEELLLADEEHGS